MPQVIQHIVFFAYKPEVSADERKEIGERFFALGGTCRFEGQPYILAINGGRNNSPEPPAASIDHVFVVTFRNEKDRDYYLVDPVHREFIDFIMPKLDTDKVRVADFETGTF